MLGASSRYLKLKKLTTMSAFLILQMPLSDWRYSYPY